MNSSEQNFNLLKKQVEDERRRLDLLNKDLEDKNRKKDIIEKEINDLEREIKAHTAQMESKSQGLRRMADEVKDALSKHNK